MAGMQLYSDIVELVEVSEGNVQPWNSNWELQDPWSANVPVL